MIAADVILHVRDMSHPDAQAQSHDVEDVLRQLGIEPGEGARIIEVWNKIDRLEPDARAQLRNLAERQGGERHPVPVSALSGAGIADLTAEIEARLAASRTVIDLTLDAADGAGLSWLYRNTEVMERDLRDDGKLVVSVRVDPSKIAIVRAKFGVH